MRQGTNNLEVKKLNRNRVFRYVNSLDETCMPDISAALDMSGPTVLTIINELKEAKVVEEVGEFKSTGGRKAKAIASIKDVKYAIGLDITKNHVSIVYTDLTQTAMKHERIHKPFFFADQYFRELLELIRNFVAKNQIPEEKIEGIGISVPAIVDTERRIITRSHVLGVENVSGEKWMEYMPYPCELLNDANAAAIAESISGDWQDNMVYLSLSNSVGGAVIFADAMSSRTGLKIGRGNGLLYLGDNWRSGEFGHMVIHPGGKTCYCGRKGCLDAYCSAVKLANLEAGNLEAFFRKLEDGDAKYQRIWREYLRDLAIAVDNLRMCFDCEVVLGGYVGNYIEPYIPQLRAMIAEKNLFKEGDYVRACQYRKEASAFGAALYQIEKYISTI